jgi:predicted permease
MGWLWRRLRDRSVGLIRQLRPLLRASEVERELEEEHRFHIEMEMEKYIRAGVDPSEARRRARVAFGGEERWREEVRSARWTAGPERLWRDVRYAIRTLRSRPAFTAVVVITLAVAIGAATAVFAVIDGVLLHPLDVPSPGRLVAVEVRQADGGATSVVSYPDYLSLRSGAVAALDGLAAHYLSDIALNAGDRAEAALGVFASADYWSVLGLVPAAGRFFTAEESSPGGAGAVAVLSHDMWRSRYGGRPDVVGRTVHVNGRPLTVIGVAPRGFTGAMLGARPAAWMPVGLYPELHPGAEIRSRTRREWLQLFGRLADGVPREGAESVLSVAAVGMAATYEYPEELEPAGARLTAFRGLPPGVQDATGSFLILLLVASGLLLVTAAVNVAGLMLARGAARSREMGVRKALGAGRSRLIRQLSTEALVLGLLGAAGGVGVGAAGARALGRVQPPGSDGFVLDIGISGPVLAFALAAGLLATLVFGLVPAFRATRGEVRSAISDGDAARTSTRLRDTLVGGQVALTLVLLVSTALLVRTLRTAAGTEHGFDPEGVVLAEVNLRLNGYDEPRGLTFYEQLVERLVAAAEIESAGITTAIPLGLGFDETRARVPGFEPSDPGGYPVGYAAVSQDYFRTLGMPLLSGRVPTGPDRRGPRALVINRSFADRFWPDGEAVGRTLTFMGMEAEVAGVVPSGKYRSFSEEESLFAYVPFERVYSPASIVLFRPTGSRGAATAAFRRVLAELDPHVPAVAVTTLDRAMTQGLFLQRLAAALVGLFAGVALLLAATGIFGLLAFVTEQRRREIGIRMAVGASAGGIVRSVVVAGLRPVAIGTLVGLAGAIAGTGVLRGLLHGIGPRDPVSFGGAAGLLLLVAALAAFFPARRATRVDPANVLRVG